MRKGELTRQAILDEAVTAARFVGLNGLTIGSLAARTELSKSGLYAHFTSKEDLQLATMAHNRERFIAEVIRPALAAPRGTTRLRSLIDKWMHWYDQPGGCIILSATVEFDDVTGPRHDQMISDERDLRDCVDQILRTMIDTRELRPELDTVQITQEIFGILMGYNWMNHILGDPRAAENAWVSVDRLLTGIRP